MDKQGREEDLEKRLTTLEKRFERQSILNSVLLGIVSLSVFILTIKNNSMHKELWESINSLHTVKDMLISNSELTTKVLEEICKKLFGVGF